ncbi:ParB N-terminal domain-containing protein [Streptomyces caniscabiei]|uniref:ParB N-terminal domain-containing protein n=1 Tax=Streptomyces caniscabiei TaxID=2746961 RepID=A0ABU4N162_9ACTN|nr:ParB N-terminal domain-containing protein [Streptomyces caniscabiei]MBE4790267.1 ParB N-terminal domain-containing protein [Streptomyces caniscabiei]MBE4799504.1 ParB N-terminal domain-containing protein [Streptomyces caniscabiei]MDX3015124.1 ParB N-terminal domain-containing protein [Streptomyces caniscabiei]MDX3042567.1 ParB N-terminal domain-containing protein [Streptomyces caniscabiei]
MTDTTTPPPMDRAAKAEALLLRFTAEAHRRKWDYDRGLDGDGVPLKSEAFDALHRLGEEMRVELEKLRALPASAVVPAADRAAPAEPVCKFEEGCHRVVPCEPGCGVPWPATNWTAEEHRLALSDALNLGTGAPWDAIHDRATELGLPPLDQDPVARRLGLLPAPADRAALRDRIAEALYREDPVFEISWEQAPAPVRARMRRRVDVVLGMLPAPADQAAVLEEAAAAVTALDRRKTTIFADTIKDAWEEGRDDSAEAIRLLAAEAAVPVVGVAADTTPAETSVELQVWPLKRILTEVRCGSEDWPWEEEWADLARRHAETGYLDRLADQISENGITMPVLIGSDGRLWDGHHRLCVAVRLGIGYVPVEIVTSHSEQPGPVVPAQPGNSTKTLAVGYTGKGRLWCLTCPRPADENVPATIDIVRVGELCAGCGRDVVDVARATEQQSKEA